MDKLIELLLGFLGSISLTAVIVIYLLLNPEKIEIWSSLLFKFLNSLGTFFKSAHKQYVRLDLQGRVNSFIKSLSKDAPFLASAKIKVQWTDDTVNRKSFLENDEVILRLKRNDPEDINFVNGAYLFVSTSLLHKAKRYIAPSQRQAIDLYVATKLIEKEKPTVVSYFLDEYLHKELVDPDAKITVLFDKFSKIDKGALFYPVFLQELDFLGDKVFGQRQDDQIIVEVTNLVDFLEPVASRSVGEETDLNFEKHYCKFAIVIVGKPKKLNSSGDVYIEFIQKSLVPRKIETIYVLGMLENKSILEHVCAAFSDNYEIFERKKSRVNLRYNDHHEELKDQYLVVLRLKGVSVFQPSR